MSDTSQKWLKGGVTAGLALLVAAILFPVFQKARSGNHHSCSSHLKNLGLALIQYSQDNDEKMPNVFGVDGKNTWREAIFPYTYHSRDLYYCPEREEKRNNDEKKKLGSDGFSQDYAANYTGNYSRSQSDQGNGAFAGPGSEPLSMAEFDTPATTIALVEVENNNRPDFNLDEPVHFGPEAKRLWAGHQGFSNYLFMDEHVKRFRPMKTCTTNSNGVLQNFWYRDNTKPLSANGAAVLQETEARFPGNR